MIPIVIGRAILAGAIASVHGTKSERVPDYITELLRYHLRVGIELGILCVNFNANQTHIDLQSTSRILSAAHRQRARRDFRRFTEDSETVQNLAARINYLIDHSAMSLTTAESATPAKPERSRAA